MKIELKSFQETCCRNVLDELAEARVSVAKGKLQAVVLSAPTGSGKTITLAAVIDATYGGGDGIEARPNTAFLWLSDSPELNVQSKSKLLWACDHLQFHQMVTIDSDSFNEERLQPGLLYFVNTQLLGKDKRLTQSGDKRQYTFWQTVERTIAESPQDFVLIIDEAHRGATGSDRTRKPIMQKFVTGSEVDGLPPVPLVLGMSATPQRFTELLGSTNRTQRPVVITPDDVRSSGLLKDMILVHNPRATVRADSTLMQEAARRCREFAQAWAAYCEKEREKETVRPILVVQVEDGTDNLLTRTNLHDVVRVIERELGALGLNEIVHCFQDKTEIEAGGRIIRKIEASRIQEDENVKVVLFKTALNTGWDCPRAEVMMSFRRAQDPTSIAQLVGRMIRTPLARRIESNEVLNTVELFLPHYSQESLDVVLARLRSPEAEEGVATRVETVAVEYPRNGSMADVFEFLKTLPSYVVERAPKMGDVKRALRLAGRLVHDGIDLGADEELREVMANRLKEFCEVCTITDEEWGTLIEENAQIAMDLTYVSTSQIAVLKRGTRRLRYSDEDIDRVFDIAGRELAAGEGLHRTFWKRYGSQENPNQAKLELYAVLRKPETLAAMEQLGRTEFERMWRKHKAAIAELAAGDREKYDLLQQASGEPVEKVWELPDMIVEPPAGSALKDHLFCDGQGEFKAELNEWEKAFLEQAMQEKGFVCWLRNFDRRKWAFCVPYENAGDKPFYPDFIIVRKNGRRFEVDVLEPHDDSRRDTWAKAKGLAKFADKHGTLFGRLLIGRKVGGRLETVDLNERDKRKKALKMGSPNDLDGLFD